MDELHDEDIYEIEQPVADRRPTWGDRFNDFVLYMGKATIVKSLLMLLIMIPLALHFRAREQERKAEQARRELDEHMQLFEQGMRERLLTGQATDLDLQLLGISPEEYAPMRAQQDAPAEHVERGDEAPADPPPPRPDF